MTVTWYVIGAIASCIALFVVAAMPGMKTSDRVGICVFGIGLVAYALFVSTQNSGTWVFPDWLFALPVVLIARALYRRMAK